MALDRLDFSGALYALKNGYSIARRGWNGKGMSISLTKGSFDGPNLGFYGSEQPKTDHPYTIDGISLGLFEPGDADTVTRLPNIQMHTATNAIVNGWAPSQNDMLAEDWRIVTGQELDELYEKR
jgi:hypothetical protein